MDHEIIRGIIAILRSRDARDFGAILITMNYINFLKIKY